MVASEEEQRFALVEVVAYGMVVVEVLVAQVRVGVVALEVGVVDKVVADK